MARLPQELHAYLALEVLAAEQSGMHSLSCWQNVQQNLARKLCTPCSRSLW